MPMCIGKLKIDKEGIVSTVPYKIFGVDNFITDSRNIELGNNFQSLTDIFLSKLLEGITGDAKVFKSESDIRIEYTEKNPFWINIDIENGEYVFDGGEPAA
jgi:hypothetical protein